jgi:very-short-patch-repair endonuclease
MDALSQLVINIAAENDGLVHRRKLRQHGVSTRTIQRLTATGLLTRVTSQVLAVGGRPLDRRQELLAAHLQAGDRSVVSHLAAAESWSFPGTRRGQHDVTIPHDAPRPRAGLGPIHRSRDLEEVHVTWVLDIPHTTPRRTLLDIAPSLTTRRLDRCLQYLTHARLATADEVRELVEALRRQGRPGIGPLDPLVRRAVELPVTESELEAELQRLLARSRLPAPETQFEIAVDGHQYRVDCAWPDQWLIVETDGHATHSMRCDRQRDAERLARLQLAGYRVLVFTYDDVMERPAYVIGTIRRHLMSCAPEPLPA